MAAYVARESAALVLAYFSRIAPSSAPPVLIACRRDLKCYQMLSIHIHVVYFVADLKALTVAKRNFQIACL